MGLFGKLFGRPKSRKRNYGRLVAWVEKKYGKINETDSYVDIKMKFQRALDEELSNKDAKAVAGLKTYVEQELFKDLVHEQE